IGSEKYKVPVYLIENDKYFNREGIYRTENSDYPDNPERFIFFSRAVLEALKAIDFKPDILHCNDMQTGLIPAYLKTLYRIDAFYNNTKTVFTIHNIAYQGFYSKDVFYLAGFDSVDFTPEKLEYYGGINFMKSGIVYSDIVTTVSQTYAVEIRTLPEFGRGLEGVLSSRSNDLFGIVNGIDYEEWNPDIDKIIVKNFSADNLTGKEYCKKDLQKVCNLATENVAIFGMVSRLDSLKGFDLLSEVIPEIVKLPLQLVVLGLGDKIYQDKLTEFGKEYSEKLSVNLKFDNNLAHKIYAGSDFFLMPSAAEPCGLSQMIAMRYGTIPVVHKTGGLADTVRQFDSKTKKGTGIVFEKYSASALLEAIENALEIYGNKTLFNAIRENAFSEDFSWNRSVKEYLRIYKLASKKSVR
ncbi:MAG: glycogen synthase, partial [Elusimicrobiota bacterium]|nr:glycogen synthase [Elusimicrobiota bacterium]